MLDAAIAALEILFTWPNPVYLVLGTVIGLVFGALPGLGGVVAVALLIPLTFGMDSHAAMLLFAATMGGVAFGGSISAIIINIPGTAPNAATLLDGYPMSQQGRAGEAIGVSATASALGAIVGLVLFILIIPFARSIILAFWSPEFFWLAIFGLTIIAVITDGTLLKGIVSGGVGIILSLIGFSNVTGVYRYGFGTDYLWDGINLIVLIIGLFAIAEVIKMIRDGGSIAETDVTVGSRAEVLKGARQVLARPFLFLRSCVIGFLIGMVPGAGGTIANFVSYLNAVQTSDDPESFGQGNLEGVLASEAANDAKDGGMLLPTTLFGIPGDATAAVLLGAFILHGIVPGQRMVGEDLPILFILILGLLFSNILTSAIGFSLSPYLVRITQVDTRLLIAPIVIVSLLGAFALRNNLLDMLVAVVFGYVGYLMMTYDYSRIALILGLILGPIAETNFLQARTISGGDYTFFVSRPLSIVLIGLTLLVLVLPYVRSRFSQST